MNAEVYSREPHNERNEQKSPRVFFIQRNKQRNAESSRRRRVTGRKRKARFFQRARALPDFVKSRSCVRIRARTGDYVFQKQVRKNKSDKQRPARFNSRRSRPFKYNQHRRCDDKNRARRSG